MPRLAVDVVVQLGEYCLLLPFTTPAGSSKYALRTPNPGPATVWPPRSRVTSSAPMTTRRGASQVRVERRVLRDHVAALDVVGERLTGGQGEKRHRGHRRDKGQEVCAC